jgi:hypothetical protein
MAKVLAYHNPPMLYNALKKEGFPLPDECNDVQLSMPVDGIFQLHYIVNLTPEELQRIGRALAGIYDDQQPEET